MARERRPGRLRDRLRRRGRGAASAEEKPSSEDRRDPGGEEDRIAPLSLGDINENRRESVARRLLALRERGPRRSPPRDSRAAGSPGAPSGGGRRGVAVSVTGAIGGGLSAIGQRIADGWHGVPAVARQRIAAALILAAAAAVVVFVLLPAAPCEAPGGEQCPPGDDAIALVPDDAIAYAHLDVDPDSEQFAAATEVSTRIPLLSRLAIAGATGELGRIDFTSQVRPWAGGEVALALLPGIARPQRVVMIEADDAAGAERFAAELLGPGATAKDVGGTEVSSTRAGDASAVLDGFLLLGDADALAEIIDPDDERGTLEEDEAADVLDEIPQERLVYGYLSGDGARALLADRDAATLEVFVDSGATSGVGFALGVEDGLVEVEIRSVLDPERAQTAPAFFSALPPFEPELPADVGSDALAYLGLGDPDASIDALLGQAAAGAPGLVAAFERLEQDLRKRSGVSLVEDLLPLLGSETAVSVEPVSAEGEAPAPGTIAPAGVPYVSLIAEGVDAAAAARSLAALQRPIVEALAPSVRGAKVAGFETAKIAGVDAQSLPLNPDIDLTYATYDDRLVIATNPLGIAQARAEGDGLETAEGFERVTEDLPPEVSLLSYLDLGGLLALGEQLGLAADPAYAPYAPDLRTLQSAGLAVTASDEVIRTDLRIAIGEPRPPQVEPSPIGGE